VDKDLLRDKAKEIPYTLYILIKGEELKFPPLPELGNRSAFDYMEGMDL
jgi:hypothetical protein